MDKDVFLTVELLEENVRRGLKPARMGAWFSGTVSLLALLIEATGIYGMVSYLVLERTSEIGIRRPAFACHSAPSGPAFYC